MNRKPTKSSSHLVLLCSGIYYTPDEELLLGTGLGRGREDRALSCGSLLSEDDSQSDTFLMAEVAVLVQGD